MATLGDFEYPEVDLADSLELARRIHDDLSGEVRRDGLAMVLGMSPTGGAYGARIGSLRMWGLATGRSVIKLTSDAERFATAENSQERAAIIRKLAKSVGLFNELRGRLGDSSADQRVLAVMLQEITSTEMDEVLRRVPTIERIFAALPDVDDALTDYPSFQIGIEPPIPARESQESDRETPLPQGWMEFRYDDGTLRLRETVENLDVMINVLEARKALLKPEN